MDARFFKSSVSLPKELSFEHNLEKIKIKSGCKIFQIKCEPAKYWLIFFFGWLGLRLEQWLEIMTGYGEFFLVAEV